jgi:hypothetical protein
MNRARTILALIRVDAGKVQSEVASRDWHVIKVTPHESRRLIVIWPPAKLVRMT